MNWRRILTLIGFLASVLIIGYGLYFLFLRPAAPGTLTNTNTNTATNSGGLSGSGQGGQIPTAGGGSGSLQGVPGSAIPQPPTASSDPQASNTANGGLTKTTALTQTPAYSPTLSSNGSGAIYYDKTTGHFYQIDSSGNSNQFSDETFFEVEAVTWSPNKNSAVLEYPDGANIIYNFSTKQQITLPRHWKEFSFSPQGDQLVFKSIGTTDDNRWLAISSADGSKAIQIAALGNKDATVDTNWSPNGQIVGMYRDDKTFDQQDLFFIGKNNETFKSVTINGLGFIPNWSPTGDRLLYSTYSSATDSKPNLWIIQGEPDTLGNNRRNLQLETWADKCSFADNATLYCAVPRNLPNGAGIFRNDTDNLPTDLYKIDLTSGFKTKIAIPDGNQNISQILITGDQRSLYFTNKDDGKLYRIDLK